MLFTYANELIEQLMAAKVNGSFGKKLQILGHLELLIIDELDYLAINLELKDTSTLPSGLFIPYTIGFLSSFLAGLWAIRWLLKILTHTQNKLIYFAYYCWLIGLIFFWLV